MSAAIVSALAEQLRGAGISDKPAEFDSSIHSWRCEYPDIYGACDCFGEMLRDLTAAVAELVAAERADAAAVAWDEGAACGFTDATRTLPAILATNPYRKEAP